MTEAAQLRIGILGAARIAANALVLPSKATPGVDVVAIAARDPQRAARFAARHGLATVHASYAALVDDPTINAIYNPLPNSLHAEWSLRALAAGKHLLCEKPLTANAVEAQQVAEAARASGRVLMEAFHYRYHPLMVRTKAMIDGGEIGAIRHVEAYFCTPLLRRNDIRYRYDLAGGATMDLGCYVIHLIRHLLGAEPEVTGARAWIGPPQIDRRMEASFACADGRTASMTVSFWSATLLRISARIVGERGEIHLRNPFVPQLLGACKVITPHGVRWEPVTRQPSYNFQLRAFAAAVRGDATNLTDSVDAVANMQVIDAVYRAAGLPLRGT